MTDPSALVPDDQRFLRTFNWGALVLTSLWLVRNGFLVSLAAYVAVGWAFGFWGMTAFSAMFFFKGTAWSWGRGNRWNSFDEFADAQATWNFSGQVLLLLVALILGYAAAEHGVGALLR